MLGQILDDFRTDDLILWNERFLWQGAWSTTLTEELPTTDMVAAARVHNGFKIRVTREAFRTSTYVPGGSTLAVAKKEQ